MRQTVQLGALSVANMGIAFLFQWYVLTQLGPGPESDALFAGMTIPQLVLAVVSGSLMHVLVPIFSGASEDRLRRDSWGLLVLIGGVFGFLAITLYVAAPWWVPITVPGFSEMAKDLTIELTRIQLIGMVFASINSVQWAAYHARQQFVWAEFTPMLASACALLLLLWALPRFGVIAAAWISTLRMALQTLLLTPGMGSPVFSNLKSLTIQQTWERIKPLLIGTAYYKTDPLVDRFLLSTASSGSLSLYFLAQQIYGAASQVINKAVAAPLVPLLSKLHKIGDKDDFWRVYHRNLMQVGMVSIISLVILILFGKALLKLLIGHGNVSVSNVSELWWIMVWLGGMFVGGVMGQISSSSFYASGDTKTPTRIGVYTYTIYIPLKMLFFYKFGIIGLALSTSAFLLVNIFLQHFRLKKIYFSVL